MRRLQDLARGARHLYCDDCKILLFLNIYNSLDDMTEYSIILIILYLFNDDIFTHWMI